MAKGGARPGSGRINQTYKISVAAARKLQELGRKYGNEPAQLLEGLVNNHYTSTLTPSADTNVEQLLGALKPEAQTIENLRKQLRMTKAELETLIIQHWDTLVERGLHIHTATTSEVQKAIKLPSRTNPTELSYYSKLSRNLFSIEKARFSTG
jgi:hypothetical protein